MIVRFSLILPENIKKVVDKVKQLEEAVKEGQMLIVDQISNQLLTFCLIL